MRLWHGRVILRRNVVSMLQAWRDNPRRKPLILQGARQVGKTTALRQFGAEYFENTVYLNFERDAKLAGLFEASLAPGDILKQLTLYQDQTISAEKTLLIFDEIQECPRALNSLKYFCEEAPEYHVASAGSLLGVKMIHSQGFPVGKVNFLPVYPLNFFEFLVALGHEKLQEFLVNYSSFDPIPEPIHYKLIELLKQYFIIGGMPEAIATYLETENYSEVRDVQEAILNAYQNDFAKHAPSDNVMKIITVWEQVHTQLAKENKKFIFSAIKKSARGREYEQAIAWLLGAGLVHKSACISAPKLPLNAYTDQSAFKLFLHDVGLLGAKNRLAPKVLLDGDVLFQEFKGSLTENFVAQELKSQHEEHLYYWVSEGKAELDFIRQFEGGVYPLEVKSGVVSKQKSLLSYSNKYPSAVLSRATQLNLKYDGKIFNYPLYLVSRFPELSIGNCIS